MGVGEVDVVELVSVGRLAGDLRISASLVRKLTDEQVFTATRTTGGHRRYDLEAARAAYEQHRARATSVRGKSSVLASPTARMVLHREWELSGLAEDRVWREVEPTLDLAPWPLATKALRLGFTGMVNNAIDHSEGSSVEVICWRSDDAVAIDILDDGVGVFAKVARHFGLAGPLEAPAELTKGKRTTAPDQHTGEGIFFTSKIVDEFGLAANGVTWIVDNRRHDHAVGMSDVHTGTRVRLEVAQATAVDTTDAFRAYTVDHEFVVSRPIVKLFAYGVTFVSRSEAKRLLDEMERFAEVVVDFAGVETVGQGFVDEVFRVWPRTHAGTRLVPINMNPAIEFMVRRGLGAQNGPID